MTTIPRLKYMLLTGKNLVIFTECFVQMYFFWMAGVIEDLILFAMAYDRYVAICSPLHYNNILSKRNIVRLIIAVWTAGPLNSLFVTISASYMSFCDSATVPQFYCDVKGLMNISCGITEAFYIMVCIQMFLFGLSTFFCSLISYIKIIRVILKMKSKEGSKAFSTCSSHVSILLLFYGTSLPIYLRTPALHTDILDQILSVVYTAVTPMLNPLIYSFRTKETFQFRSLKDRHDM
ncbi:olfactory receptor 1M1-like [Gastrophryne carolinensis]